MTQTISHQGQSTKFLSLWIAANLLGGFFVGLLENNGLQFMATLILTGAIVGSLQWWVLRQTESGLRWWPLVSALGWIASTFLMIFSQGLYSPVVNFLWQQFGLWEVFWLNLVTGPISILGMALAQGYLLSRRGRFIGPWLLASLLGGAAYGMVSASLCAAVCQALPTALVGLVNGAGWAAYGLFTGAALLWRRHRLEI
ncbi:MAG: hypothetical protein F6J97_15470 [Leptolyngbya sp. SIO4C1]|nr:hypothetical protein [Leptolyngbya sp. SIO4C1]